MKFDQLVEEVLEEEYLEEVNWKGALAAGAMLPSLIGGNKAQAQQAPVTSQQPAITQNATANQNQQPKIVSSTTQQDVDNNSEDYVHHMNKVEENLPLKRLYNYIINSKRAFTITRELLIKTLYKPDDANVFLNAMPENVKKQKITIYGVNSSKDILDNFGYYMNALQGAEKFANAFTTQTGTVYFTQNAKTLNPDELMKAAAHEIFHNKQYSQQGYYAGLPGSRPENTPVAHFDPRSSLHTNHGGAGGRQYDADDLSTNELEAYVVGGRDYWGAVNSEQDFENKWNYLEQIYNKVGSKNFWTYAKLPEQTRRQFYLYKTQMLNKVNQEAYKQAIKKAVMNPQVSKNTQPTNTRVT